MKKPLLKRAAGCLLAFVMVYSLFPAGAVADWDDPHSSFYCNMRVSYVNHQTGDAVDRVKKGDIFDILISFGDFPYSDDYFERINHISLVCPERGCGFILYDSGVWCDCSGPSVFGSDFCISSINRDLLEQSGDYYLYVEFNDGDDSFLSEEHFHFSAFRFYADFYMYDVVIDDTVSAISIGTRFQLGVHYYEGDPDSVSWIALGDFDSSEPLYMLYEDGEAGCGGIVTRFERGNIYMINMESDDIEPGEYRVLMQVGEEIEESERTVTFFYPTEIQFGTYPQSLVDDADLIEELEGVEKKWKNYDFYCGSGNIDETPSSQVDLMRYADFNYKGEKYRAVSVQACRPYATYLTPSEETSFQPVNGYNCGTYYFRYEPVTWRILDRNEGLVMADLILDVQAFMNSVIFKDEDGSYRSTVYEEYYANNYQESSIRRFLNNDFYRTAFTAQQKELIDDKHLDNDAFDEEYEQYSSESFEDRVFPLSWTEARNWMYGFDDFDGDCESRTAECTDYAVCMGLELLPDSNKNLSWYWLRTAGAGSDLACSAGFEGELSSDTQVCSIGGVRPAMVLKSLSDDPTVSRYLPSWNQNYVFEEEPLDPYVFAEESYNEISEKLPINSVFAVSCWYGDAEDIEKISLYEIEGKREYVLFEDGEPKMGGVIEDEYEGPGWMTGFSSANILPGEYYLKLELFYGVALSEKTFEFALLFGSYPQTQETDEFTCSLLDEADKTWESFGYYSGTGEMYDGLMAPSDFMEYADFEYGSRKYRAVRFSGFRPSETRNDLSRNNTYQIENGYGELDRIYYFKYEPVEWRVLDYEDGLVMAELSLDAQAFSNVMFFSHDGRMYNGVDSAYYASDYAHSSLREWLNGDFYDTAFTDDERADIRGDVELDNSESSGEHPEYDAESTFDKVFVLSYSEAMNESYGFSGNGRADPSRSAAATDYAKCQGVYVIGGNSPWWLRSASESFEYSCGIYPIGQTTSDFCDSIFGVRPAMRLLSVPAMLGPSETEELTEANVTLSAETFTYNGAVQKPTVAVKNAAGDALAEGTDYTLVWSNASSKAPGTYTVTVTAAGEGYNGSVEKTYTIKKQPLAASRVTLSATSFTYNGAVQKPTVTVKNAAGTALKEGTSYTVEYSAGCKKPGTYTVTVTAYGGHHDGTASKTLRTTDLALVAANVTLSATSFTYNGAVQKPTVTVKSAAGTTLAEDTSYTLTWSNEN
ncbi:MAG: DUF6273 domain-containing protein, partial [Clostridia bacterium]|nr:DUF6273 domain-containing protein [Clostridia bacterium]